MNSIIISSIIVFFFYWMINYSLLLIGFRKMLGDNETKYPLFVWPFQCSFCFAFWIMLVVTLPVKELFAVPVVVMFLNLLYIKLGGKVQE